MHSPDNGNDSKAEESHLPRPTNMDHTIGEFRLNSEKTEGYINIPKNASCTLKGVWGGTTVLEPDPDIKYTVYLRKPIDRFYSSCYTYGLRNNYDNKWDKLFKYIISDIENNHNIFYDAHMTPQYMFIEPFIQYPIKYIILETANIQGKSNISCKKAKQLIIDSLSPYKDKIEQIYRKDVYLYNTHFN